MDERSYVTVARILNAHGIWTTWCSVFLTDAGFKLLGVPSLERSLRKAGWTGTALTLHRDIEIGGGYGFGNILVDDAAIKSDKPNAWLILAKDHTFKQHPNFVVNGKRVPCA
jgi:hypothetical protein